MLGQRRRRLANIKTTLGQRLVFAGLLVTCITNLRRINEKHIYFLETVT